ncbi:YceD family protein [Roseicyclus marinus]|uniref:YceD family protein n=1 Tax=Roseicyclus marinus TaxID=2161673 RepID=UPI00240EE87F|nr:YceD family protein [Roseicyclus marinus]MDG3040356.1 YceD family protein [Roseicyclus marinus]
MAQDDTILTLARLPRGSARSFEITPDAAGRARLADELNLSALRKLRFAGSLLPEGARDWRLEATLGATVVQPCVVTAEPVTTRIDDAVLRRYLADMDEPTGDEVEMPEDDTAEPLPATLDLGQIMAEALALALPLYPRAEGAALDAAVFAPPGVAPLTDEVAKPLAGLAALRDRLTGGNTDDGNA